MKKLSKEQALARYLEIPVDEALELIDSEDYLVLDDKEADKALIEHVEESLWAFVPSFLAKFLGCPVQVVEAIQANDKCEDNNEIFQEWLESQGVQIWEIADKAANIDGRGHFISLYDGQEIELLSDYFAYRLN